MADSALTLPGRLLSTRYSRNSSLAPDRIPGSLAASAGYLHRSVVLPFPETATGYAPTKHKPANTERKEPRTRLTNTPRVGMLLWLSNRRGGLVGVEPVLVLGGEVVVVVAAELEFGDTGCVGSEGGVAPLFGHFAICYPQGGWWLLS